MCNVAAARRASGFYESLKALRDAALPGALDPYPQSALAEASCDATRLELRRAYNAALDEIGPEAVGALRAWPERLTGVTDEKYTYRVRDKAVTGDNYTETLSRNVIPKIAAPRFRDWGEILQFILSENLPGSYPYAGGVYPYRREEEDPTRMFAGEGAPERTNRRFHYLAKGSRRYAPVHRLRLDHAVRRGSRYCVPTSTAVPATPASRSRRWTT